MTTDQRGKDERGIFREQALSYLAELGTKGDVIRVSPVWASAAYWVVVLTTAAAIALSILCKVSSFASGPAIIHVGRYRSVLAIDAGMVQGVVAPGTWVRQGEPLARVGGKARRAGCDGHVDARYIQDGQTVDFGDQLFRLQCRDPSAMSVIAILPLSSPLDIAERIPLRISISATPRVDLEAEVVAASGTLLDASTAGSKFLANREPGERRQGLVLVVEANVREQRERLVEYTLRDGASASAEVQLDARRLFRIFYSGRE